MLVQGEHRARSQGARRMALGPAWEGLPDRGAGRGTGPRSLRLWIPRGRTAQAEPPFQGRPEAWEIIAVTIDNSRVSDLPWDDVARLEAEMALHGAAAEILAEAWAYVSTTGLETRGLHHEVRDGVLILNRSGVYQAMGDLSYASNPSEGASQSSTPEWMPRADRIKALQHLQKHAAAMNDMTPYEGE